MQQKPRILLGLSSLWLGVSVVALACHEANEVTGYRARAVYHAMIAAGASPAACAALWSEDMRHGMVPENRSRIVNPFREPD
jgi:predicted nucleic acid-binding protein